MRLSSILAALWFVSAPLPQAQADVFTLGSVTNNDTPTVATVLTAQGFSAGNENTLTTLTLPGAANQTSTVTFTYVAQGGGFHFSFGFFARSAATANPAANPALFAQQGLAAASEVFREHGGLSAGDQKSYDLPGGTELVFYLIPDNSLAAFNANPGAFFPSQTANNSLRSPLFSLSDANPGGLDQMLSFQQGNSLLLPFEDLTRTGSSDRDFNDSFFRVEYTTPVTIQQNDPVPEPTSLIVLTIAGAAGWWVTRRT